MVKITIPEATPPSWNKFYSGIHFGQRKQFADNWHEIVWLYAKQQKAPKITNQGRGLHIEIACYFPNYRKTLDADNICAKLVIDGLKGVVIEDDSWKHVKRVTTSTHTDSENPRTEIIISWV